MAAGRDQENGWRLTAFIYGRFQRSERRMFAEQVELPRVVVMLGCNGIVVTAYFGEVGRLELQGEFHQGVCNVSGSFIGNVIAHPDRYGAGTGNGIPFKVRRMASRAPIARRRAVLMTDRTSAQWFAPQWGR